METEHEYGSFYPGSTQRRMILTYLHKGCGGQVVIGWSWLWKAHGLKHDGRPGCCLCKKQPLEKEEIYQDYR